MREILIGLAAAGCSIVLTAVARRYALEAQLIDTPNHRSSHEQPTPRGGGVSIVVVFTVLLAWLYWLGEVPYGPFVGLLAAGLLVAAVGLLDDRRDVPSVYRLIVHFMAAATAVYFALSGDASAQFGSTMIHLGWYGAALAAVGLVWFTNLFNFMDGIDGLAASEAAFVVAATALLASPDRPQYLLALETGLAAACVGFLLWNWPPARIFLGDVGSGFLGITIGALSLVAAETGGLPIWTSLILAGAFIVDATVTLLTRIARGERWYAAHRSHAYQHAARRWGSHARVCVGFGVVNVCWLLPIAFWSARVPSMGPWLLLVAWLPLALLAMAFRAGRDGD